MAKLHLVIIMLGYVFSLEHEDYWLGEHCAFLFQDVVIVEGIINQTSCSHISQQNEVAKQTSHYLLDIARILFFSI